MRSFGKNFKEGFTLVELLVVIAIIGLLSTIVYLNLNDARENAKVAESVVDARALKMATLLYYHDMEFYPPDVNRGWDPGFTKKFPYNPDTGKTDMSVECDHCPPNWKGLINQKWNGPYIGVWPRFTAWEGKYDYNYWGAPTTRYGCYIPAGIYIGVQRDYDDENPITPYAEQIMVNKGYDYDGCVNGEAQMILYPL